MAKKRAGGIPIPATQPASDGRGAGRAKGTGATESAWQVLVSHYPGHPCLQDDAVYALPTGLIDAIQRVLPKFWTSEAEAFERELAASATHGFFLGRQIGFPSLDERVVPEDEPEFNRSITERAERVAQGITALIVSELNERGRSEQEKAEYFAKIDELKRKVAERQLGYAGWLATSPDFHRDRDQLRKRWAAKIREIGYMPRFPRSLMGENPPAIPRDERDFYSDYMQFYRRWGLDTLATWDLPVPMRPELASRSMYPLSRVGDAGVVMFVPWYLLRDKDITLREIADHHRHLHAPAELASWLDGLPKNWGHDRYRLMLELYIYLELCLKRRSAARLHRNLERLDLAISRFLAARNAKTSQQDRMAETVKRVRLKMMRRLR